MARKRGQEGAAPAPLVIDTNVIISAMVKEAGFTRRALLLLTTLHPAFAPRIAVEEIRSKTDYLARRKGLNPEKQQLLLATLLQGIEIVGENAYTRYLEEARRLVRDPADSDFAALALKLTEEHGEAIIITYNKRDYIVERLAEKGVKVLTPREALARTARMLDM